MDEDFEAATDLDTKDEFDRVLKVKEQEYQKKVIDRLHKTTYHGRPNPFLIFALQAPIMLLSLSVMAFLAGLCSVVFAPLSSEPVWDENAKVCAKAHFWKTVS